MATLDEKDVVVRITKTHINLANILVKRMNFGKDPEQVDAINMFRGAFAYRFASIQAGKGFDVQRIREFAKRVAKNRQMYVNFIKLYTVRT